MDHPVGDGIVGQFARSRHSATLVARSPSHTHPRWRSPASVPNRCPSKCMSPTLMLNQRHICGPPQRRGPQERSRLALRHPATGKLTPSTPRASRSNGRPVPWPLPTSRRRPPPPRRARPAAGLPVGADGRGLGVEANYGTSSAPREIAAYGSDQLTGDLCGLLDHYGYDRAHFTGHDWGSMVVWEMGRLHSERVSSIYNMSVPYSVAPASPPLEIFDAIFEGKFFYMLYFQEVGPPEQELEADPRLFLRTMLWSASGEGLSSGQGLFQDVPREGTGFLDILTPPPASSRLDHRGRRRLRRGLLSQRLRPISLPQHGRQSGCAARTSRPPCTPCPSASSPARSTPSCR